MALLYPWATKEYLLWEMSLGQILMYFNLGMDTKYPKPEGDGKSVLAHKSHEELKRLREEMKTLGLVDKEQKAKEDRETKEALSRKYGDI